MEGLKMMGQAYDDEVRAVVESKIG
jgi:hypothetical protein